MMSFYARLKNKLAISSPDGLTVGAREFLAGQTDTLTSADVDPDGAASLSRFEHAMSLKKIGDLHAAEAGEADKRDAYAESKNLSAEHLGISYGATGLPLGFEHMSFDQTDVEFERIFQASNCINYPRSAEHPGAPEVCFAQFKRDGHAVQISAWFVSGRMTSMAELIQTGCADHNAEFTKRFASQNRANTKLLAGAFLPYRWLPFAESATISAWSANDEFHTLTACQKNGAGMVLLARGSLRNIEEQVRTRRLH